MRRCLCMVVCWSLAARAWAADCATTTTGKELRGAMKAASRALEQVDETDPTAVMAATTDTLRCLGEKVSPADVMSLDLMLARSVGGTDPRVALAAFRGAQHASPGAALSEDVVPAGHALREIWAEAERLGPGDEVAVLADGVLVVDGRETDKLPLQRAAVVQVLDPAGAVLWTAYRADWSNFSDTSLRAVDVPLPPVLPPVADDEGPRLSRPLLIGAAGAALLSGGLYLGSAAARDSFFDTSVEKEAPINSAYWANHGLVIASGASALVSVGLGVGVLVGARW